VTELRAGRERKQHSEDNSGKVATTSGHPKITVPHQRRGPKEECDGRQGAADPSRNDLLGQRDDEGNLLGVWGDGNGFHGVDGAYRQESPTRRGN